MSPGSNSIRVRFRAFRAKSDLIDTRGLMPEATRLVQGHLDRIVEYVREYPPPWSATYVRTFRLYRGWRTHVSRTARGLIGSIYNVVYYATRVQGPKQQERFAIHRWRKLENYLFRDEFRAKVAAFGRRLMGKEL